MPNFPKAPLDFRETGTHVWSTHQIEKDLFATVISKINKNYSIESEKLELQYLGFSASKSTLDMYKNLNLPDLVKIKTTTLMPHISNIARREALTSHVLSFRFTPNFSDLLKNPVEKTKLYSEFIKETSEIYKLLVSFGEPAAATILANLEHVSVRTIQTRLRLAREKGYLKQPGSGKRFI